MNKIRDFVRGWTPVVFTVVVLTGILYIAIMISMGVFTGK